MEKVIEANEVNEAEETLLVGVENPFSGNDLYCCLCHKCNRPHSIYKSHNIGDPKCTQLSLQVKSKLSNRLSSIACSGEENDDRLLAAAFGYNMDLTEQGMDGNKVEQVNIPDNCLDTLAKKISTFRTAKLGYIKPEPTQLLNVFNDQ